MQKQRRADKTSSQTHTDHELTVEKKVTNSSASIILVRSVLGILLLLDILGDGFSDGS
jgi:hypothetical protein